MKQHEIFNIVSLFEASVKRYPDRIAIIDKNDAKITYSEMADRVNQTAAAFTQKGLQPGDRVLVFVPMGIDLYVIVLASFKIGAIVVFVDKWANISRLNQCCKLADCKAFVGSKKARLLSIFSSEIRKIPIKIGLKNESQQAISNYHQTDEHGTALITFTTGSTGQPKAAKRTHAFLKAQFDILKDKMDTSISKVDMPVLPIVLLINLGLGITSVIANNNSSKPQSMNSEGILSQIEKHQIASITASPFFILKLSHWLLQKVIEVKQVKRIFTGGAAVFQDDASIIHKAFPYASSTILYGSTEAEPISSVPVKKLIKQDLVKDGGLYVGEIDPAIELMIIKIVNGPISCESLRHLKDLELSDSMQGEIIVSGKHVLREYYKSPEATARQKIRIHDKVWHRTGDSGFRKGNRLFLCGPCSALIQTDSGYFAPFVFEERLKKVLGVECGTIVEMQSVIFAVVQANTEAGKAQIERDLLTINGIDKVHFVKNIPRDPRHHSKIEYEKLKEQLSKNLK